jgi:glutaredoxin 2
MKLFIYDHCPYCVKARIIFGLKNIDFELVTLLNDDEKTPISMIGQKMLPIIEKEGGGFMAESLDIIDYIDGNYGDEKAILSQPNQAISKWLFEASGYLYELCMPRWAKSDLEEFKTKKAIEYFTQKKEGYIGPFKGHLESSERLIELANQHLVKLDFILNNSQNLNIVGKISSIDVDLFATIRSLSIVKGIKYPENVEKYRKKLSKISNIPLHDNLAI